MNKTISLALLSVALLSGCTNLTYHEQQEITRLSYQGISIDRPSGQWEKPASPLLAGVLNILPGVGNFYLASGNAGDSSHWYMVSEICFYGRCQLFGPCLKQHLMLTT